MSVKVGQAQQAGAAAASRSAGPLHASPATATRQVDGLSGANRSGPEDDSLLFGDTWEDMQKRRPQRRQRLGLHPDAVRFGDILASEGIGTLMLSYRAQDMGFMPSLRFGAMLYEQAKAAVVTGGNLRPVGGQLNRYL